MDEWIITFFIVFNMVFLIFIMYDKYKQKHKKNKELTVDGRTAYDVPSADKIKLFKYLLNKKIYIYESNTLKLELYNYVKHLGFIPITDIPLEEGETVIFVFFPNGRFGFAMPFVEHVFTAYEDITLTDFENEIRKYLK